MTISQGTYAIGSNSAFQNLDLETSLKFKGAGDVRFTSINPYDVGTEFTVQTRVYLNTVPSVGDEYLIFNKSSSGTPIDNSLSISDDKVIFKSSGNAFSEPYTPVAQQYITISVTVGGGFLTIYINGLTSGPQAYSTTWHVNTTALQLSLPVAIGTVLPFDGKMLYFRLVKRIFSTNEVLLSMGDKLFLSTDYVLNSYTKSLADSVLFEFSIYMNPGIRSNIPNLQIEFDKYEGRYDSFIDAQLDIIDQTGNLILEAIENIAHPDESIFDQNKNGFQFLIFGTTIVPLVLQPTIVPVDKTAAQILRGMVECYLNVPEICDTIINDCAVINAWECAVKWWILYRNSEQSTQIIKVDSSGFYTFTEPPAIPRKIVLVQKTSSLEIFRIWSYAAPIFTAEEDTYLVCYEQNMMDITQLEVSTIHKKLLELFYYESKIKIGQFLKFSDFADSPFDIDGESLFSSGAEDLKELKEHIIINRDEGP